MHIIEKTTRISFQDFNIFKQIEIQSRNTKKHYSRLSYKLLDGKRSPKR